MAITHRINFGHQTHIQAHPIATTLRTRRLVGLHLLSSIRLGVFLHGIFLRLFLLSTPTISHHSRHRLRLPVGLRAGIQTGPRASVRADLDVPVTAGLVAAGRVTSGLAASGRGEQDEGTFINRSDAGEGDMPSLINPDDLEPRSPAVFISPPPLSPYASPAPHGHDNWTNAAFPFYNSPSPLQYAYPHAFLLHPHLSNMPGQFPFLSWDIIKFPSTALYHAHPSARPVAYALENSTEPATHPPCTYLTISFADNPRLAQLQSLWGGPIRVRTTGAGPITLENVLAAIHGYFRQRITRTQKMYMREGEWDAASVEYYRRLARRDIPDLRGVAEARGVLRSDVLGGATRFAGLRMMGTGREWLYLTLTR
ncbi:hypothetical protein C8F01DRAFT_1173001 [Mycena amicta]|nr:hypothetical protein C8F01DRAFT_1173001 [Mycena amicta]